MNQALVVGVGYTVLCLLGCHDAEGIRRCLEVGLAGLVSFLVLAVGLHLRHLHIMDQLGVVLKAAEADEFPLVLFIT